MAAQVKSTFIKSYNGYNIYSCTGAGMKPWIETVMINPVTLDDHKKRVFVTVPAAEKFIDNPKPKKNK